MRNFLKRIEHGMLVITPGDRSDVIVACLSAVSSMSMPNIAGILLTGGLKPEESVCRLIDGFPNMVPILSVAGDTFPSTILVSKVHAWIFPDNGRKINRALEVFDQYIDSNELAEKIIQTRTTVVTPKMFEYGLLQKARAKKQHIVLPEGEDERILCAAEILLRREVADLTLLGNKERIHKQILRLGLRMDSARIMEIRNSEYFEDYVQTYYDLRKHKGMTLEAAKDFMSDANFFGTMMVRKGHADGMVSGAVHTTQATIRPAFEIIKTKAGFSVVSSVFFVCLKDRGLVYGDCTINPDPDSNQLAKIAVASAQTARIFDIEPKVAMLSYSTGESGKGEDVEKVRKATQLARDMSSQRGLDLKLEGPRIIDETVIAEILKNAPLAPLHNPPNLTGIRVAQAIFPEAPQVAVFDTAFHQTLPRYAYIYALPYDLYEKHRVRRYGFHGTSHAYVAERAAEYLNRPLCELNLITLHLGNGASMAAIQNGRCVDTSMGLTPLEGLVMGTRSGDMDPAIPFFLANHLNLSLNDIDQILNKESGLKGICGANDMRVVLDRAAKGDDLAGLALEVYTYRIKKYIGAYAAVLGRLDALIFTGGIGENAPAVRELCCKDLTCLNIEIDPDKNHQPNDGPRQISPSHAGVKVLVVPTNEELKIARETLKVVKG